MSKVFQVCASDVEPGEEVRLASGRYGRVEKVEPAPTKEDLIGILDRATTAIHDGSFNKAGLLISEANLMVWQVKYGKALMIRTHSGTLQRDPDQKVWVRQ